ncbi:ABC transporter permease [Clostridium felsineum]|uniref:ABC transporter permease n=1 Tax=Clostridium felsineum TaxID=36839 RepID=UPI002034952C|nr:ABC transporter permease [Clostridium felsineum]URZ02918.1 Oligopeptide transport system permease protein OppC [Clostridium felsineum]
MAENSSEKFKIIGCENNNSEEIVRKNVTYWQDAWRRLKQNKVAVISLALLIVIILLAIIGPMLRPFTTNDVNDSIKNIGSNSTHWLGTDDLGRDLWVRLWVGTRSSIIIGIVGASIELVIGALYGGISGYFGGIVDDIMMRIIEILNSIPYLILVLIVIIVLNSTGIIPLIIGMTLTGWVGMARIVRGQVLSIKEQEYVLAAKTLGAGSTRIIMKHLLPNVIGVMIVDVTFAVPSYIFAEAFLSYIGLGVKPPSTSLGALCSSGQQNLMFYPSQLFWPSLIICLIMLTFNLLGDGLSEALDPKQRQ